jgi:hypothetical protein
MAAVPMTAAAFVACELTKVPVFLLRANRSWGNRRFPRSARNGSNVSRSPSPPARPAICAFPSYPIASVFACYPSRSHNRRPQPKAVVGCPDSGAPVLWQVTARSTFGCSGSIRSNTKAAAFRTVGLH